MKRILTTVTAAACALSLMPTCIFAKEKTEDKKKDTTLAVTYI